MAAGQNRDNDNQVSLFLYGLKTGAPILRLRILDLNFTDKPQRELTFMFYRLLKYSCSLSSVENHYFKT